MKNCKYLGEMDEILGVRGHVYVVRVTLDVSMTFWRQSVRLYRMVCNSKSVGRRAKLTAILDLWILPDMYVVHVIL